MAELVHCNSCGGSFRYDPPPRREMHSGAMYAEPMDGPLSCRRCGRAVTDPPPRDVTCHLCGQPAKQVTIMGIIPVTACPCVPKGHLVLMPRVAYDALAAELERRRAPR